MKQKANTGMVIAAVAVLVIVLGFLAWRSFGNHVAAANLQTIKAR